MALNIFNKKTTVTSKTKTTKPVAGLQSTDSAETVAIPAVQTADYRALRSALLTEKAATLEAQGQYVFHIWPTSNKQQVKQAVENLYKVKVTAVRIINLPDKKRQLGRTSGIKAGVKKAIVRLAPGQSIELIAK